MERRFISMKACPVSLEKRMGADGKEESPMITGYGVVYYDGTPDTEYSFSDSRGKTIVERIMPGACDSTLANDNIRGLFNHDANNILGTTGAKTMRLMADKKGVRYEIDPADTTCAKDVQIHLQRGDVTGSSFSFDVASEHWMKENGVNVREVRSVAMYDIGPVTFPAYESTTAGVRSAGDAADAIKSLEKKEQRDMEQEQVKTKLAGIQARVKQVLAETRDDVGGTGAGESTIEATPLAACVEAYKEAVAVSRALVDEITARSDKATPEEIVAFKECARYAWLTIAEVNDAVGACWQMIDPWGSDYYRSARTAGEELRKLITPLLEKRIGEGPKENATEKKPAA